MNTLFATVSEKGGVGKTTCSQALYDRLNLLGFAPAVIQIDRQHRLRDTLGAEVLTIGSDPKSARTDPQLEIRRFSPILEAIETAAGKQQPTLLDIGAGEVGRFAAWASLVDLEEELNAWQIQCTALIPFLSEAESIRQAVWTAERLRAAMPQCQLVFAENRRDGRIAQLHSTSAAAEAFEKLTPWLSSAPSLVMPAIPGESWRHFEAINCRFIEVVDMTTEHIMDITGLPRAEAKIARGDISQWLVYLFEQFDRALGFEEVSA